VEGRNDGTIKLCFKIKTLDGPELERVDEMRYLGTYIVRAMKFKCYIDHAKRSFYRVANSIFWLYWPLRKL